MNFKEAHSTNFKKGRESHVTYLVIHYTANNGDTAKNNVDYYAREAGLKASAHYFVDENEVWQSVSENDTAYHCGSTKGYKHPTCRNINSIGIEICSRKDKNGKYYFHEKAVSNAAVLTKRLMEKYKIPVACVIRHYDVTGKICPAPFVNDVKEWAKFKDMLKNEVPVVKTANDIDYALKWKYGITFDSVENEREFIKLLDEEREKSSKLYWVFYKLANL